MHLIIIGENNMCIADLFQSITYLKKIKNQLIAMTEYMTTVTTKYITVIAATRIH